MKQPITPFLWFDNNAEEAVNHYLSVFKNSEILKKTYYEGAGSEVHGKPTGSVMTIEFKLNDQPFIALNGGPQFKFTEAISFVITCEDQTEIDYYWNKLTEDGEESNCGWLKDKYGLSWQVVPAILPKLLSDPEKSKRVTETFMKMKKFDIEELLKA